MFGASGLGFRMTTTLLLMDKILHDPKDPKLWELWYLIMGNAGFCPSAVSSTPQPHPNYLGQRLHADGLWCCLQAFWDVVFRV